MIRLYSIVCFLFSSLIVLNAQNDSSIKDVAIQIDQKTSEEVHKLLHAVNYDAELYKKGEERIRKHIANLRAKNLQQKPLKKQIQVIYKSTHAEFFKKYNEKAFFNQIFLDGNYNCVSASALYALVFEEFNINYAIKETPSHVYLIADTLNLQTLIESTLPGTGVVSYNEKFKKDFISYLNKNKIISDQEFNSSTTEDLFRKYFSKDKTINLHELAALQFYNKGIFLFNEEKYEGAVTSFSKALDIYPSNTIKYMHYASVQNAIHKDYQSKKYNGKLFGNLVLASISDSSFSQLAKDYFNNISIELCVNAPDIKKYKSFYSQVKLVCVENDIPAAVQQKYHYYLAYNLYVGGKYPAALKEIKNAYYLNTRSLLPKQLALEIASKHLLKNSGHKRIIDSLEYYFDELPILLEEEAFQLQYSYCYMKVISDYIMYDEPEKGEKYFQRYLNAVKEREITYFNQDVIEMGFGTYAMHMAEEGNFDEAVNTFKIGLELVPESLALLQYKKELASYKEYQKKRKAYEAIYESTEVVYSNNSQSTDKLKNDVEKYFPGNWKAVSIVIEDMEQDLNAKESFSLKAEKNKNCIYTINGKTLKGKWAYRPKSKCIYFVPDYDKDEYVVFKVKEANANKLVLLPYKDQRTPSPYKYILKPTG